MGGRLGDTMLLICGDLTRAPVLGEGFKLEGRRRGIHSNPEKPMRHASGAGLIPTAACLLIVACGDGSTPAAPVVGPSIGPAHALAEGATALDHTAHRSALASELAQVRGATARFHRVENAIAAGYELGWVNGSGVRIITGCVAHPTEGAMGYHYFKQELVDDLAVDPLEPEVLVYASGPDGELRLAAVEWVVRGPTTNPPGVSEPPTVLGMEMHILVPAVGLWLKHAWIWKHNPAGMFADWNPEVSCP